MPPRGGGWAAGQRDNDAILYANRAMNVSRHVPSATHEADQPGWPPCAWNSVTRRSPVQRALVQLHPAIPLPLRPQLLRLDSLLFRRGWRFRFAPLLRHVERVAHEGGESLVGGGAVLLLAAPIARDDAHHSVAVEASGELRPQAFALLVAHGT